MKQTLYVIFLSFIVIALAQETSDVIVLTDSNFDSTVSNGGIWLIEFYAPWCGHCKKLIPVYEKLATDLKGKVNVAKIDCTVEKATADRFGITGFPTIKLIADNKVYKYQNERTVEAFSEFALGGFSSADSTPFPAAKKPAETKVDTGSKSDTPSSEGDVVVITNDNYETLIKNGAWLIEFYAPWCGHCKRLAPTFEKVATALKGKVNVGKVDCTVESALQRRFGVRGYPTIKFVKDGQVREYKGDRSESDLIDFTLNRYKNDASSPMPEPRTAFDELKDEVSQGLKVVERFLQNQIWVTLGVVFVFGLILGKLVLGSSSAPVPPRTTSPVSYPPSDAPSAPSPPTHHRAKTPLDKND